MQRFTNQQKIRDEFFGIVRKFLAKDTFEVREEETMAKTVRPFYDKIQSENVKWFVGVFCEEYLNVCIFKKKSPLNSGPLGQASVEKLEKLESRFYIPDPSFGHVFSQKEIFFVKFVKKIDATTFVSPLIESIFERLFAVIKRMLLKASSITETVSLLKGFARVFFLIYSSLTLYSCFLVVLIMRFAVPLYFSTLILWPGFVVKIIAL